MNLVEQMRLLKVAAKLEGALDLHTAFKTALSDEMRNPQRATAMLSEREVFDLMDRQLRKLTTLYVDEEIINTAAQT